VSGGIVFVVSITFFAVSAGGVIVVSTFVLSVVPDTFFVELHADTAMVNVPATARLKISFFIICFFKVDELILISFLYLI
jgi:hypothetical protein